MCVYFDSAERSCAMRALKEGQQVAEQFLDKIYSKVKLLPQKWFCGREKHYWPVDNEAISMTFADR